MGLLNEIKYGNEIAFRQLYNDYKVKVYNYFIKKINNRNDAEDLLQNTFLRIWKYRESLNGQYSPDQQIFYIARTVFIDYTRSQNKLYKIKKAATETPFSEEPIQELLLENKSIHNVLIQMPELRRKAFIMHKIEGYSYKEIAQKLSVNVKSIDNNIARALKQIKKAMLTFFM